MTISKRISKSAKHSKPPEPGMLSYMRARHRANVHELVLGEFEKEGMSRAELARRLDKAPEQVTRLLAAPGNWTLDTVSDLLFAISGGEVLYAMHYPQRESEAAMWPEWLRLDQGARTQGEAPSVDQRPESQPQKRDLRRDMINEAFRLEPA